MSNKARVITPAQAIGAYEKAFRSGNPHEVERLLRDVLNVQVAVVESVEKAQKALEQGKKFLTLSVPYGVFLGKSSGKEVYRLDFEAMKRGDTQNTLRKVSQRDEILPNCTYVLLKHEAGYSHEKGLTFEGEGEITGFEDQPESEQREKLTEGCFQTWMEHAQGVWQRSEEIVRLYEPFIKAWADGVLSRYPLEQREKFVENLLWAFKLSALLHDIGKLNEAWQETVWENEERIRGRRVCWRQSNEFIARTSPVPNSETRKHLKKPPAHAPFAYPLLKTLLRALLSGYRIWDIIALATARHHSLEVGGIVEKEAFHLVDGADKVVEDSLRKVFGDLTGEEQGELREVIKQALEAVREGSEADEPPSPSDDFYFIYCIASRLIKVCDWEDAGGEVIELPDIRREKDAATD